MAYKKKPNTYNRSKRWVFKRSIPKKQEELNREKIEKFKLWITFYRRNIHRFIMDYMKVNLYPYQVLFIWMLQNSSLFYAVASRATGKSFLIAVFAVAKAILYPGSEVVAAASTMKQAGVIINDKVREIYNVSPNVRREILSFSGGKNGFYVDFKNGSRIVAVPSTENARGTRATYLIVEESRLVTKEFLDSVFKPFLRLRNPPFVTKKPYAGDTDYDELGVISYITSAWYTSEDWYQDVKSVIKRMLRGDKGVYFMATDFLVAVRHRIKSKAMLKDEMMNATPTAIRHEYYNLPSRIGADGFFDLSYFKRTGEKAFYPQRNATYNPKKNPYQIAKVQDEKRILSADISTRRGSANDLTIFSCIRLIPMKNGYHRELVYMESHSGLGMANQALRAKQLFFDFEADYMALDTQSIGLSLFEELGKNITDPERNVPYPAFTICPLHELSGQQFEDYISRVTGANPLPVVFPVMASASLNSLIANEFKSALQGNKWEFLLYSKNAENYLIDKQPEYTANPNDSSISAFFLNPYVQTDLFIEECMNLEFSLNGGLVKLDRKNGRKDRYSSVSYGNHLAEILDRQYRREDTYEGFLEEMQNLVMVF